MDDILIDQLGLDKNNHNDMLRLAFYKGAKWWEYHSTKGTMWQSDQKLAWEEACTRHPAESNNGFNLTPPVDGAS